MSRSRATRTLLSVTASLSLVLTGCGGSTSDEGGTEEGVSVDGGSEEGAGADGGSVLAAAVEQSSTATTARTRFTSVVATPDGDVEVSGEGVSGPDVAQITMTLGGVSAAAFGADQLEIEVRLLDGVMYQRFPELIEQLGVDADWLAFDLASLGPEFGQLLEQAQQADPSQTLQQLQDVADVVEVGSETVNGVETTKYEGTLVLRTALETAGVDPSMMEGAGVDLDASLPVSVWIDGENLIRRYETSMDVEGMATTTSFEVLEYGVDVDVQAPPADRTVDFGELMSSVGG